MYQSEIKQFEFEIGLFLHKLRSMRPFYSPPVRNRTASDYPLSRCQPRLGNPTPSATDVEVSPCPLKASLSLQARMQKCKCIICGAQESLQFGAFISTCT